MKFCNKCKTEKSKSEFHKDSGKKDGLCPWCKPCRAGYDHQYFKDNKHVELARMREWHKSNPEWRAIYDRKRYAENRESELERGRMWRENNKHHMREYRNAHKEERSEYNRHHYLNNPDMYRSRVSARRARLMAADGSHTAADIRDLLELQRHKCAYCKTCVKGGYHVDHIVALSKGGGNGPDNLQILCPFCNLSKGAKCPIEFAQENGRLL